MGNAERAAGPQDPVSLYIVSFDHHSASRNLRVVSAKLDALLPCHPRCGPLPAHPLRHCPEQADMRRQGGWAGCFGGGVRLQRDTLTKVPKEWPD